MVIEGDRIILRSWQEDDIDAIIDGLNNIEVSKWLSTVPYPYDKEEAKKFLSFCKEADKGTTDITNQVISFTCQKKDKNGNIDSSWVQPAGTTNSIVIGPSDVASKAIFTCEVEF